MQKQTLDIDYSIPQSTMYSDELMIVMKHGKFTREFFVIIFCVNYRLIVMTVSLLSKVKQIFVYGIQV